MEEATFAGGCFWCVEGVFKKIKGVTSVLSGYCGGTTKNPTYDEVCNQNTGHAEAVQIKYNPDIITYEELLEIFFSIHNPTTLNREGPDIGTQYRSVIFYHNQKQRDVAKKYIDKLENKIEDKIVTQIEKLEKFYIAEEYHQDYYEKNPSATYCKFRIDPKIKKLKKEFKQKIN